MREKIGDTAGKVWRALGEKGAIAMTTLPKMIKEKNELTFQALGWLAHEGKVAYKQDKNRTLVSLTEQEQETFRTLQ
jgi:hypothetical protein